MNPLSEVGEYCPLGEAVYLVVEEDDVDVDIPPDGVNEMVASDSHRITIAGCHPTRLGWDWPPLLPLQ